MYLSSSVSKSAILVKKFWAEKQVSVKPWMSCRVVSAFFGVTTGAIDVIMKCNRGNGTKLVWNSFKSTFNSPSNRNEAVMDGVLLFNGFSVVIRHAIACHNAFF
eukprot:723371_1